MEKLSMCRICLATDVRLCSIASHLRDMFERISSMTFKREDRRPLVACYICHARLQNCYRLRTSCLQSEELLTEMQSSGELKPQDMLSTNSFRVVSALHLSLGPALQDSTECHLSDAISDAEFDQLYTEDIVTEAQEEQCALIEDNNRRSHLEDPLDIIKEEADDVEADAEYIKLEEGNINLEEIDWKPDIAGPSLQLVDVICPKIVKVVLERIDLNDSRVEDLKHRRRATEKISIEATSSKLNRNKEAETEFGEPRTAGAPVSALKDTKDATFNERKIEVIENEQTETITFEEPKMVTKKIEVEKSVTTSLRLETSVLISVVNDVCEQKSTNDTYLEQNVSSSKGKPFSCDTCNKCFGYKHVLKNHILAHTSDKAYQCNICNKCFTQTCHLKTHIRIHSGEKPYQCNICNKCFTQQVYLKRHIRTRSGDKPYQCNICTKCFTRKDDLKRHIRTHSGDKPYQCNICNKCFTQKGALKRHIRTHSGDKPYHCNVCNKCFTRKCDLEIHIRIHSGEKPYQCNVCKKCFIKKCDLIKHIRIHSGEKPYQCNVCNKCFNRKDYLKTHIRAHSDEKPYQCYNCNKCFKRKDYLKTHNKKKHILVR